MKRNIDFEDSAVLKNYASLLNTIKGKIAAAQTRAHLAANHEMITLYWYIGKLVHKAQQKAGWGAGVIAHLSRDLKNDLPDTTGFSERNISRMRTFFLEYQFLPQAGAKNSTEPEQFLPHTGAKLIELILHLPWRHNVAEYALRGVDKSIGISDYKLTQALPADLKSSLPSIDEIEQEFEPLKKKNVSVKMKTATKSCE